MVLNSHKIYGFHMVLNLRKCAAFTWR